MLFKKQHKEKSYTQNFIFRMRIDSNLLHFKNNSNRFRYKMKLLYEFHFLTSIWFKEIVPSSKKDNTVIF